MLTALSFPRNVPSQLDKIRGWRRLDIKDRKEVMENVISHEDWKVCFSELAPGLVLFARQYVRSAPDAEDIVQEAFVRFWRKQHSIQNRALLFATVRSVALDLLRRDSRRLRREANAALEVDQFTTPQFDFDDGSQQQLAAAVDQLPAEQREVLVMKIWNELTFADIGEVLGISQNTAASRYRYALAALKKNFVSHE
jgi:RNA polymerase sigma-70 factor (ECF subfamily)